MIILFGTKAYLYQLAVITLVCGRCGGSSTHALYKRVTKFTLFFVPLFPISTKYTTRCGSCGAEQKVPKEQAEGLVATLRQDEQDTHGRLVGEGRRVEPGWQGGSAHAPDGGGTARGRTGSYGSRYDGGTRQSNPFQD